LETDFAKSETLNPRVSNNSRAFGTAPVPSFEPTPVKCAALLLLQISPQYHLSELQGRQGTAGQANVRKLTQKYLLFDRIYKIDMTKKILKIGFILSGPHAFKQFIFSSS
jgi:hypothetical protein